MAVTGRGLIGTGSATSAGTTITVANTTGAVIPAGTFIHITGAWDNINSVTAPTITSSTVGGVAPTANHATAIGSGVTTTAGSGVWHQCFRVLTTGTIASGGTIATLTSNQSAVKRAAHAEGFNNCTATLRGTVTTGTSAAGTPTVTTTGTALVIGDLVIGSISLENNAQATADADTTGGPWPPIVGIATSGGGAAANVDSGSQYKILTATGTQTFNPTCPAADAVVCVYSLVPVPEAAMTQAAYRHYADGTETGSAALAAQDTAYEADVSGGDVNLAVRVRVQSTNAGTQAAGDDYRLQYAKNGGTWTDVDVGEALVDSYPSVNGNSAVGLKAGSVTAVGQSFLGNGRPLSRLGFYLRKTGTVNGTVTAALYAHTGTYGTTGKPTGTALATSTTTLNSVDLPTTNTWTYFNFASAFTLVGGTAYVAVVSSTTTGDPSNQVVVLLDSTSPTHAGNEADFTGVWDEIGNDLIFEVYAGPAVTPTTVLGYGSASLTDGAVTTNRLGAGTGSFSAGEVSEDGLVDDLLWTANNYTELLYSITLKQADLTDGDTLTFRVLRNGATTGFTYTAVPTVDIGGGVPNIPGTALISIPTALTVAGTPTTPPVVTGTALISSSVDVTVAGTVIAEIVTGTAVLTESVAVTAAGVPTTYGTALVSQSVAVTASGTPGVTGTAALTESVAVTATGTPGVTGTALISQSVAVTSIGTTAGEAVGTALLTVPVTVAVVGRRDVRGAAAITMAATVTVAGTRSGIVSGTGQVGMSVAVAVAGTPVRYGTATLTAAVDVSVTGQVVAEVVTGTVLIASSVVVSVSVLKVYERAPYTATATFTYTGTVEVVARGTAQFDYCGGWDTAGTATVDHDYGHSWELV